MSINSLLIAAVNKVIFDKGELPEFIDEDVLQQLLLCGKRQDLAHIVATAFLPTATGDLALTLKKEKLLAVYRRELLDNEQTALCAALEKQGVDFILLKGAVIKELYPEGWMRTASDIDVLVREEQKSRALNALVKAGYEYNGKSLRDYQLFSKNKVHVELQFDLSIGNESCDALLAALWENAILSDTVYRLPNEYIIFYNVAHAYFHFAAGGCGIKPFIDHILLTSRLDFSLDKLLALINKGGLADFYNGFYQLALVWFGDNKHTPLTKQMEEYIFSGGVYGTKENFGKAQAHKKGRGKYLLSRIFKPKKELAVQYPCLEKHPILLPFYQVRRWFNLISRDKRRHINAEVAGGLANKDCVEMFDKLGIK